MNFQVPANEHARDHVKEKHDEYDWRYLVLQFLHNHTVQYTLMALLLLDVIILFVEIFLASHYPPCDIIERDCISCCSAASSEIDERRFLSVTDHHSEAICDQDMTISGYGSCDEHKWHTVHTIESVLFWCTITILVTFLVEINLEMVALGPNVFFRQFFYLVDYIIIVVSTTLELLFYFDSEELGLSTISGLIIFARIWRFVRVGHAIVEVTTELTHQSYEEAVKYVEELEAKLENNKLLLPDCPESLSSYRKAHAHSSHDHKGPIGDITNDGT